MDRYPYLWYTILLGATRALAHIGVHFTHHVFGLSVVVDRLTKSAHFLLVRNDYSLDKLAELYIKEIVQLHGIPIFIISDRDKRFTS